MTSDKPSSRNRFHDPEFVKVYIDQIHSRPEPLEVLLDAIDREDLPVIRQLIADNPHLLNERRYGEQTPLHLAVKDIYSREHVASVETLLELGADVNVSDENGWTPLHLAADQHLIATMQTLLHHGAQIDARDNRQNTPLHLNCKYSGDEDHGITGIQLLLEHGADPNAADDQGNRPLHVYRMEKSTGIKHLVKHSADLEARNKWGMTPLHSRAIGWPEPFAMLIRLGADVSARDKHHGTPLHHAVATVNCRPQNVKALLEAGIDLNARDKQGRTPLHLVATYNSIKVVRLLLGSGADINARDEEGRTPLWRARYGPHQEDDPDYNLDEPSYRRALKRLDRQLEEYGGTL